MLAWTLNGRCMSTNKLFLHGFLGRDPELKMTPAGVPLCRFSVATTETWKTKEGEKKSKTEWHNVVAWNKQAENIEKFFKKGSEIMLEGKVEYTEAKNPADESKKIWYTHVKLISFDFCGKSGGSSAAPDPEETGYQGGSPASDNNGSVDDDQDIPFWYG